MRTIKVKKGQSLTDIALQEYGHIEGLFLLVADNTTLEGITDNVFMDEELLIGDTPINSQMRDFLADYTIATIENARGEGIGYWRVNKDFIVS